MADSSSSQEFFDRGDVQTFWRFADEIDESDLPAYVRHVALVLWRHMRPWKMNCDPSRARIAEKTGLSERQIQRAFALLRNSPLFKVSGGRGRNQRHTFKATIPQRTLFELNEMLSRAPKASKRLPKKETNSPLFDAKKETDLTAKGDSLSPEDIFENINNNNSPYPHGAGDGGDDQNLILSRLQEAAGEAIGSSRKLSDLGEVRAWLDAGFDLEADILPAITDWSARCAPGSVISWGAYREAVRVQQVKRLIPPADAPDRPKKSSPWTARETSERNAWAALERLKAKLEVTAHG